MLEYPSIQASTGTKFREFEAHVFLKLDGSNLRFEYSRKKGFHKYGTRHRLFDETDEQFGDAVGLFKEHWEHDLTQMAKTRSWDKMTAFFEYYGPNSFAGYHEATDKKKLTLFDVAVNNKGLLGPAEFLEIYSLFSPVYQPDENQNIALYLGKYNWTRGFVESVRNHLVVAPTAEGVVGKAGSGHKIIIAKAKTQAWLDKLKTRHPDKYETLK